MNGPELQSIDAATSPPQPDTKGGSEAKPRALAGAAGVLGSSCCVGPPVAVSLGLGGGVAAALLAFAPYRPIFILLAFGAEGIDVGTQAQLDSAAHRDGEFVVATDGGELRAGRLLRAAGRVGQAIDRNAA